jgi:hypothetical protein
MPRPQRPVLRVKHVWGFFGQWFFGNLREAGRQREICRRRRMSDYRRRGSMTYNRRRAMSEPD